MISFTNALKHSQTAAVGGVERAGDGADVGDGNQQAVRHVENDIGGAVQLVGHVHGQMLDVTRGAVGGVVEIGQHIVHQHVAHEKRRVVRHDALPAMHQLSVAQIMRIAGVVVVIDGLVGVSDADILEVALVVVEVEGGGGRVVCSRIAGASTYFISSTIIV